MSLLGTQGGTQVFQAPGTAGTRPPGYKFAQWLASQLPALMNTPFPTYQGNLDPGLSPTLQDVIRRSQGYAQSSPPEILQGVQGSLMHMMNPNFINPWNSLFRGGAPAGTIGAPAPPPMGGPPPMPGMSGMGGGNATLNPWNAGMPELFGGANNYMQVNPNQRIWGGGSADSLTYHPPALPGGQPQVQPQVPTPAVGPW